MLGDVAGVKDSVRGEVGSDAIAGSFQIMATIIMI